MLDWVAVFCFDRMKFYLQSEDHRGLHQHLRKMAVRRKTRADPNLLWRAIWGGLRSAKKLRPNRCESHRKQSLGSSLLQAFLHTSEEIHFSFTLIHRGMHLNFNRELDPKGLVGPLRSECDLEEDPGASTWTAQTSTSKEWQANTHTFKRRSSWKATSCQSRPLSDLLAAQGWFGWSETRSWSHANELTEFLLHLFGGHSFTGGYFWACQSPATPLQS